MPAPIQSSPGAPLTLTNGRMATRSGAGARRRAIDLALRGHGGSGHQARHEHRHDDPNPKRMWHAVSLTDYGRIAVNTVLRRVSLLSDIQNDALDLVTQGTLPPGHSFLP